MTFLAGKKNHGAALVLLVLLTLAVPAGAGPCGYTQNDCPKCPSGGLTFTNATLHSDASADTLDCVYGSMDAMNYVHINIACQYDTGTAARWVASAHAAGKDSGERVMPQADIFNTGRPRPSWSEANYQYDWTAKGQNLARVNSYMVVQREPVSTMQTVRLQNIKRVEQYVACFASFSPSGIPGTSAGDPGSTGGSPPAGGGSSSSLPDALAASIIAALIGALGGLFGALLAALGIVPEGGFASGGEEGGQAGGEPETGYLGGADDNPNLCYD